MEEGIKLIGKVHSGLKKIEDCPLLEHEDAPEATIEIFDDYLIAMQDIKTNDQLILLTWLHQSDRTILMTKPRNDPKAVMTGVFSTRSPDRPNPIGVHFVKVVSISGTHTFRVSGLEVLDQTPVIDIKPVL